MENKEQLLKQYKMNEEEGIAYFDSEIALSNMFKRKKGFDKSDLDFMNCGLTLVTLVMRYSPPYLFT